MIPKSSSRIRQEPARPWENVHVSPQEELPGTGDLAASPQGGEQQESEHAFWQVLSMMRQLNRFKDPEIAPRESKHTVLDQVYGTQKPPKASAALPWSQRSPVDNLQPPVHVARPELQQSPEHTRFPARQRAPAHPVPDTRPAGPRSPMRPRSPDLDAGKDLTPPRPHVPARHSSPSQQRTRSPARTSRVPVPQTRPRAHTPTRPRAHAPSLPEPVRRPSCVHSEGSGDPLSSSGNYGHCVRISAVLVWSSNESGSEGYEAGTRRSGTQAKDGFAPLKRRRGVDFVVTSPREKLVPKRSARKAPSPSQSFSPSPVDEAFPSSGEYSEAAVSPSAPRGESPPRGGEPTRVEGTFRTSLLESFIPPRKEPEDSKMIPKSSLRIRQEPARPRENVHVSPQ
ncbi:uncharacterized protein [Palaemon carinicauda]|uniref:uncharacterized protein n=1 Tax=Palaemon carinicauda TaxID=392227 RepID=UPI0035B63E7F